jgi:hypothetical protein
MWTVTGFFLNRERPLCFVLCPIFLFFSSYCQEGGGKEKGEGNETCTDLGKQAEIGTELH